MKIKKTCPKKCKDHRWVYMNSWDSYPKYKFVKKQNNKFFMEVAVCYDCETLFVIKKMPEIKNAKSRKTT